MISLLLQADTTQVAASASTENGTLFWLVIGVVALMAFLAYWLLKPAATTPPTPIQRTTAHPEDGAAQAIAQAQAVAAELARQQNTTATRRNEPSTTQRATTAPEPAAPVKATTTPVTPALEPAKPDIPTITVTPTSENESPRAKAVDPLAELEKRLGVKAREVRVASTSEKPVARGSGSAEQQTPGNGRSGVGKEVVVMPLAEEKLPSTVKYIGYQPLAIPETGQFPRVRMPKAESVIKFPRVGRSGRRGYTEAGFMLTASALLASGAVKVYNDRHVPTPNALSPYEPDLVVVNELNGLNLFLTIEIDEPYDGVYRQPIHCKGEDDARDDFFTRRGWIVVRFAEIQIHQQPKACCAYVAQLISQLDPTYQIPTALIGQVLQPVAYWDTVQAQKWAKQKYREAYLGIPDFGRRETQAQWSQAEASDLEKEVEKQVDKTASQPPRQVEGRLAKLHSHERDAQLQFDAKAHQYLIEGQPATAVSTLVDRFFPEFDRDRWAPHTAAKRGVPVEVIVKEWDDKGKTSAALGTRLHEHIEEFYNTGSNDINLPEFKQFLNFHGDHGHLTPHRTEWRVFNEDVLVAGTLDFVAQHPDGSVSIYDWKRSEKVIHTDGRIQQNGYQTKEGPLGDLDDSRFSRYSIQQNLYKWLLESKYGCRVRSMHLVVLHPAYNSYTVLDVPDRTKHVQRIVESLHSNV